MIKKLVGTLISAALVLNLAVFPVFAEQTDSATYVSEPSGESSGTVFESDYRA